MKHKMKRMRRTINCLLGKHRYYLTYYDVRTKYYTCGQCGKGITE